MSFGIDNRELLPPFFPVGRNEDGIFGRMLERCSPGALGVNLPWGILHEPPGLRRYQQNAAVSNRISDIILACVASWPESPAARTPRGALRSLGRYFGEIAELSLEDLRELIRDWLWRRASRMLEHQEALLEQFSNEPSYWAANVRRQNEAIRAGMTEVSYLIPCDLRCDAETSLEKVRYLIMQFGKLLCAWPDIVDVSKALAKRDIHPASCVAP